MPDLKVAEQKFNALRQELDELGYRHTLPLEAVPLVRRVFDDLIHTTESLRKWRDKATDFEKELMVLRKAVEPYQRENGELLHVNAEHHLELLQLREHEAKKQAELKVELRRLRSENDDLRFLNSQLASDVHSLTEELQEREDALAKLHEEHDALIVVQGANGRKQGSRGDAYRQQRMEISAFLRPPSAKSPATPTERAAANKDSIDVVALSDRRIAQLQTEVASLEQEREVLVAEMDSLRAQVSNRNEEMARLQDLLKKGRPASLVVGQRRSHSLSPVRKRGGSATTPSSQGEDSLQHGGSTGKLGSTDEVKELQRQLKDALERQHDAMKTAVDEAEKNRLLMKELRDQRRQGTGVPAQPEKRETTKVLADQLPRGLPNGLTSSQDSLGDREMELAGTGGIILDRERVTKAKKAAIRPSSAEEAGRLKLELEREKLEVEEQWKRRLAEAEARLKQVDCELQKCLREGKELRMYNQHLVENEKELLEELDQVVSRSEVAPNLKPVVSPIKAGPNAKKEDELNVHTRRLEEQRDFYRAQVAELLSLLRRRRRKAMGGGMEGSGGTGGSGGVTRSSSFTHGMAARAVEKRGSGRQKSQQSEAPRVSSATTTYQTEGESSDVASNLQYKILIDTLRKEIQSLRHENDQLLFDKQRAETMRRGQPMATTPEAAFWASPTVPSSAPYGQPVPGLPTPYHENSFFLPLGGAGLGESILAPDEQPAPPSSDAPLVPLVPPTATGINGFPVQPPNFLPPRMPTTSSAPSQSTSASPSRVRQEIPTSTGGLTGGRGQPTSTSGLTGGRGQPTSTSGLTGGRGQPTSTNGLTGGRGQPTSTNGLPGGRSQPTSTNGLTGGRGQQPGQNLLRTLIEQEERKRAEEAARTSASTTAGAVISRTRGPRTTAASSVNPLRDAGFGGTEQPSPAPNGLSPGRDMYPTRDTGQVPPPTSSASLRSTGSAGFVPIDPLASFRDSPPAPLGTTTGYTPAPFGTTTGYTPAPSYPTSTLGTGPYYPSASLGTAAAYLPPAQPSPTLMPPRSDTSSPYYSHQGLGYVFPPVSVSDPCAPYPQGIPTSLHPSHSAPLLYPSPPTTDPHQRYQGVTPAGAPTATPFQTQPDSHPPIGPQQSSDTGTGFPQQPSSDSTRLHILEAQVRQLQQSLNEYSSELTRLRSLHSQACREREHVLMVNENLQRDLKRIQNEKAAMEAVQSVAPSRSETSPAIQMHIKRIEREKASLQASINAYKDERDHLRERMRVLSDSNRSEKLNLCNQLDTLKLRVASLERDRQELLSKEQSLKMASRSLETQIRDLQNQLLAAKGEIGQTKANAGQIRALADQSEKSLRDLQTQLSSKSAHLANVEQRNKDLAAEVASLRDQLRKGKAELENMRTQLDLTGCDKENLMSKANEHANRAKQLEAEREVLKSDLGQAHAKLKALEGKLDEQMKESATHQRELGSLQRQFYQAQQETQTAVAARQSLSQEIRRLQEQLSTLTNDNRRMGREMAEQAGQNQDLMRQLQEYINEVKRVEELLRLKDKEREELLEQYNNVSVEKNSLEHDRTRLENDTASLRVQADARDQEIRSLKEALAVLDQEVQEHVQARNQYQLEAASLRDVVNQLEGELHHLKSAKTTAEGDVTAARDLCVQLDMTKDQLNRELARVQQEKVELKQQVTELMDQVNHLSSQLSKERIRFSDLENQLSSKRETEFQRDLEHRDLTETVGSLKRQMQQMQERLDFQTSQASQYRAKSAEMDIELEHVKRQLTNEKFERERLNQELKTIRSSPSPFQRKDPVAGSPGPEYSPWGGGALGGSTEDDDLLVQSRILVTKERTGESSYSRTDTYS